MASPPEKQKRQLARLCDLVSTSLLPHLEPGPLPTRQLTREDERRLLLALSKVNNVVRRWDQEERGCELDQETVSDSGEFHSCCLLPEQHPYDEFGCLANVVSILVGFLDFCSDYVKHSVGKTLISISSTLIEFESIWIQFIELLWIAINEASKCVYNSLPSTTDTNCRDITSSRTYITRYMTVLNQHRLGISGQTVASLFQVLRAILKFLKHSGSELKDDFVCLSIHHIEKVPWDSFHQLHVGESVSCANDSAFSFCNDSAKSGIMTASLLQLLCSLLEQSYVEGTDGQNTYVKLVDIVPKIAASLQRQHDGPNSLYKYLKHKSLMVMIRLKPYMQQDCSRIVYWVKLLRQYFEDVLHGPIFQHIAKPDNLLEGSPFLPNTVDLVKSQDKPTRHLQRQAIYLFLSCSICLSYNRNESTPKCSCKRDASILGHKVHGCSDHCNCIGLQEISNWFQRCFLDVSFDSKSSTNFALSFLELYIEELGIWNFGSYYFTLQDDMLFSILLQLLDAPLIFFKMDNMETTELIGAKLFSSIFDPVHLFHLLLLLLHYDHMVLVDYLISKDVGVHCAQYLLRCLRLVSQSWHAFVDDSAYETNVTKLNRKRQITSSDISDVSSSKEYINNSGCDIEGKNPHKLFLDAKLCLYSLKRTVEDLQKKGLFPYNPKALLRSLARFEELCEQG